MKAHGDCYNAWRREEGTANENHPINVLCAHWYNVSLAFSLQKQTQFLLLHNDPVISHSVSRQTIRDEKVAKQQLKTSRNKKNVGPNPDSYLWRRWRRGVQPVVHWWPGPQKRSWTVPGGCGPSTDSPAASSPNLPEHARSASKRTISLQRQQRSDVRRELGFVNTSWHKQVCFHLSIYATRQNLWLPGAP